ncbi:MAG: hypothetical protein GY870_04595, partial [archaeon]|nr:hypothetical protein [archaeon]
MSSILEIISGQFEIGELIVYIPIQITLLLLCMFIAYLYYPKENHYSIMTHTISFLGVWTDDRNPKGWYWLTIGEIIYATMNIPLYLYLHSKMILIGWGAYIGFALAMISTIAMILVALIPDNENEKLFNKFEYDPIHNAIAAVAILGSLLTILWYGILFLLDFFIGAKLYSSNSILTIYLIFLIIVAGFFYTQLKWAKMCKED